MAVNHADGTMFTAIVFCPVAAGWGAAHAGGGWLTFIFVAAGFLLGVGVFLYCRAPIYAISGFGMKYASKMPRLWLKNLAAAPSFIVYLFLPYAILWGAVAGVYFGSEWLVRHL